MKQQQPKPAVVASGRIWTKRDYDAARRVLYKPERPSQHPRPVVLLDGPEWDRGQCE